MDYIIQCDTTKGTWQRHENSIILTTDCKSVDAKDNVLLISPIEFSDSIKLKVVISLMVYRLKWFFLF